VWVALATTTHRQREQHQSHPGRGGHSLAPAEPARRRRHVPEHGSEPARHRDGPVAAGQAEAGGDHALEEVADQHHRAGPTAHRAKGVGRAWIARALTGGVATLLSTHQDRRGERAQQVGDRHGDPPGAHQPDTSGASTDDVLDSGPSTAAPSPAAPSRAMRCAAPALRSPRLGSRRPARLALADAEC
jgi:hypothetical protein